MSGTITVETNRALSVSMQVVPSTGTIATATRVQIDVTRRAGDERKVIEWDITTGIDVYDTTGIEFDLTLTEAQTGALPSGKYIYDGLITLADDSVKPLDAGVLIVTHKATD